MYSLPECISAELKAFLTLTEVKTFYLKLSTRKCLEKLEIFQIYEAKIVTQLFEILESEIWNRNFRCI